MRDVEVVLDLGYQWADADELRPQRERSDEEAGEKREATGATSQIVS